MKPRRIEPGPNQESVWDYPRPPCVEDVSKHIKVVFNDVTIADSRHAKRVLETSHPPVYYIPPGDIRMEFLVEAAGSSFCEWKGQARYYTVVVGDKSVKNAAWSYPDPTPPYQSIKDHLAFYVQPMDACYVGEELARPQPGGFYGGWVTSDIVGPFKGQPGTERW